MPDVNRKRFVLGLSLMLIFSVGCGLAVDSDKKPEGVWGQIMSGLRGEFGYALANSYVPMIAFENRKAHGSCSLLQEQTDGLVPVYRFFTVRMTAPDAELSGQREISMLELETDVPVWEEIDGAGTEGLQEELPGRIDVDMEEILRAENEAAHMMEPSPFSDFIPHERQNQIDLGPLSGYDALVSQFYIVDANTMVGSDQLDVEKFMSQDMTVDKSGEEVQILIYHTHSQEGFSDSVPGDDSTTIMGVGEYLTQILTEMYGYKVLHHYGKYDVKTRDEAYSRALPEIEGILRDNPSIEVVIDLHRDQMPEGTRLVTEVDGRPTAKFMFFNGLSRTKKTGNISYLYNENQEANLALSFQMQLKAMEYYPGLTRKIYLKGYRYNMHLCPKYMLIELGAQNNTLEEAMNACEPLAHILDLVLSGQ